MTTPPPPGRKVNAVQLPVGLVPRAFDRAARGEGGKPSLRSNRRDRAGLASSRKPEALIRLGNHGPSESDRTVRSHRQSSRAITFLSLATNPSSKSHAITRVCEAEEILESSWESFAAERAVVESTAVAYTPSDAKEEGVHIDRSSEMNATPDIAVHVRMTIDQVSQANFHVAMELILGKNSAAGMAASVSSAADQKQLFSDVIHSRHPETSSPRDIAAEPLDAAVERQAHQAAMKNVDGHRHAHHDAHAIAEQDQAPAGAGLLITEADAAAETAEQIAGKTADPADVSFKANAHASFLGQVGMAVEDARPAFSTAASKDKEAISAPDAMPESYLALPVAVQGLIEVRACTCACTST